MPPPPPPFSATSAPSPASAEHLAVPATAQAAAAVATSRGRDVISQEATLPPWDPKGRTGLPGPGAYDPTPIPRHSFNANFTPNPELPGYGRFHSKRDGAMEAVRRSRSALHSAPGRAGRA